MPLYLKDDVTASLVARLAAMTGLSKQAAVRRAVEAELARSVASVPLGTRLARLWQDNPMPPPTGRTADKAFFDDLAGDP